MIEVVTALIVRNGRALLQQRPDGKYLAFRWETPGGKVEESVDGNESHHGALRRELREELGIEAGDMPQSALWCGQVDFPDKPSVFVLVYRVLSFAGEPKALEGQGLGWFTYDQMQTLDLTPGNRKALEEAGPAWRRSMEAS